MEIKITINGIEQFTEAVALLASAIAYDKGVIKTGSTAAVLAIDASNVAGPKAEPAPISTPVQLGVPTVPIQVPIQPAIPITQQTITQQPIAPAPVVPTQGQTYSMEQLAVAATQLMDAGRRQDIINLLAQFGVQALTALSKEQYGNFATALRAMGAKI